ncbi:uncharacterized protein B0P05DRAFT_574768 [Gilbertella persicaria]|uniref:uncharacterized protein n=1 Tax=Gilbertella persicaria TaxID=101096 RepID=UPI00221F05F9|nr:uncharacterized protein B0P05DRAFT_574768 [Gilbertella persicaria]KAI8060405.1 hypothetical protein B0P05DRAFT_574768 [Gilbertella persicaria]
MEKRIIQLKKENHHYKELSRSLVYKYSENISGNDNSNKYNNGDNENILNNTSINEDEEIDELDENECLNNQRPGTPDIIKSMRNKYNHMQENENIINFDEDISQSGNESIYSNYSDTNKNTLKRKYKKSNAEIEIDKVKTKLINNLNILSKNNILYLKLKNNNRDTLKLLSEIYLKYINDDDINYIDSVYECYDKNKSRFLKNLEISYKIHSSKKLVNSNYIFPLYTFNKIKKTSVDELIYNLENIL